MALFTHDYGLADRLMHRLALGSAPLAELSFELDQRFCGAARDAEQVRGLPHVFVTGLARAGTTILLRHLHETGRFRSLTYRDMPFPLAPNLWKRFSGRWQRRQQARMRAHGDGIAIDAQSPEALEEVFWRIHCGPDYIRPDGLVAHQPDGAVMALFVRYVTAILASGETGQERYLSKNNNNILRLDVLRACFPQAAFVIPFRHPMLQAMSLWRQHRRFTDLQRRSPFVRSYMDWLGHHEFGLGHRPFLTDGHERPDVAPSTLEYWLRGWIAVYSTLARQLDDRCILVCYDDLCGNPAVWLSLLDRLDLPDRQTARFVFPPPQEAKHLQFETATLKAAEDLFDALRRQAAHGNESATWRRGKIPETAFGPDEPTGARH